MAIYSRTSYASVGGCGPDDTIVIMVEVLDMLLKCHGVRLLSGADMLEKEMGMRRGLEKSPDRDGCGHFDTELHLYIHSAQVIMFFT